MAPARTVGMVALLLGGAARAEVALQGAATVAAGVTDNALGTATDREADVFLDARPSLTLTIIHPRAAERISGAAVGWLFLRHSEAHSIAGYLDYASYLQPSAPTALLLGVGAAAGQIDTFSTAGGSAATPLGALPGTTTRFFEGHAQEAFSWDVTPAWRAAQSAAFNAFVPLPPSTLTRTWQLDQHLIAERAFRRDAAALDLAGDYVVYETTNQQQLLLAPSLRWRHDWGRWFASEAAAGVAVAFRAQDGSGLFVEPIGRAALRYYREEGEAELGYAHLVQPNIYIGQTIALDQAAVRGALPLDKRRRFTIAVSAGYQHGRMIAVDTGAATGTLSLWLADATFRFRVTDEIELFARYQLFDQQATETLPSLLRNIGLVGVSGTFPGRETIGFPARESTRVDRADEVRLPALHSD